MAIPLECPECEHGYLVRDELAGTHMACRCGRGLDVPQQTSGAVAAEPRTPAPEPVVPVWDRPWFATVSLLAAAGMLVLALVLAEIGPLSLRNALGESPGYATPEEAFQAAKEAVAANDWRTGIASFSPDSQRTLVGFCALAAVQASRGDPDLRPLLQRHGVDVRVADMLVLPDGMIDFGRLLDPDRFRDPWQLLNPSQLLSPKAFLNPGVLMQTVQRARQQAQQFSDGIQDKPGFFAELMEHLQRRRGLMPGQSGSPWVASAMGIDQARLSGVVIEGNTARGHYGVDVAGRAIPLPVSFEQIDGRWYNSLGSMLNQFLLSPCASRESERPGSPYWIIVVRSVGKTRAAFCQFLLDFTTGSNEPV